MVNVPHHTSPEGEYSKAKEKNLRISRSTMQKQGPGLVAMVSTHIYRFFFVYYKGSIPSIFVLLSFLLW